MTWVFVIALALIAFGFIVFVFKTPRGTREAVAAALLLGLAGYVTQGSPTMPGAPKPPSESMSRDAASLVEARLKVTNTGIPPNNKWVVIADGLARNGRYADAAQVLRGAIEQDPGNSEAWLAMANSLMAHSEGVLTPAAIYAYRRAAKADPNAPGPPFFFGLALLQSGKVAEARSLWADVLDRAPEDAEWRGPLEQQLKRLDAVLSQQPVGASDSAPSQP